MPDWMSAERKALLRAFGAQARAEAPHPARSVPDHPLNFRASSHLSARRLRKNRFVVWMLMPASTRARGRYTRGCARRSAGVTRRAAERCRSLRCPRCRADSSGASASPSRLGPSGAASSAAALLVLDARRALADRAAVAEAGGARAPASLSPAAVLQPAQRRGSRGRTAPKACAQSRRRRRPARALPRTPPRAPLQLRSAAATHPTSLIIDPPYGAPILCMICLA